MPGRVSSKKYTADRNAELEVELMDVLSLNQEAMTMDEIRASSITLEYVTPQKLARLLSKLCEMGFVAKAQSKARHKMVYKSVSRMIEQGYEVKVNAGSAEN